MNASLQRIQTPFVVFLGDGVDEIFAKTALGLVQWRGADCVGQIRLPGCRVDTGVPDLDVHAARAAGARSLIVGSATVGGRLPENWVATVCAAAAAGLDIVAGLHVRLEDLPGVADAARRGGSRLLNIRVPPTGLPVGSGRKRSGRRLLTLGTDCACGKKYTALALDRDLRKRGVDSSFRATGQTGIMIAGEGMPLDAVVADFLTGAAEVLSPDADPDHWDVIEGQGALFHPGYLQVTIGLLIGSQPDAFIVCHDPRRTVIEGWENFPLPTPSAVIERAIALGRLTNPQIRCVGIALNTSKVDPAERARLLASYARETGLPCVDPIVTGTDAIVNRLLEEFPQSQRERPQHRRAHE
ncbi:MAG: DUF1611 domain-containing protein [Proteobacteria bacterium]|nr:DUF1611 domain-containing protein [Pseudomonadota bacterium]